MRRFILVLTLMLGLSSVVSAQNYALVNSEKIFKSVESYNAAISELDKMAQEYQTEVDEKFKAVENLYNAYMQRKSQLSEASQAANEENILKKEQEATEYQESIFGTDGVLMKKRLELIQPIQKLVFATIEEFAKAKGYDMVLDISQNATMLYYSPKADHTEAIIAELKKKNDK
ncbi:MAG: OmpH family outer membrane protein [Alistipes sp.]|nr:OmpH family outer membrane protein [Alistipes sp.]